MFVDDLIFIAYLQHFLLELGQFGRVVISYFSYLVQYLFGLLSPLMSRSTRLSSSCCWLVLLVQFALQLLNFAHKQLDFARLLIYSPHSLRFESFSGLRPWFSLFWQFRKSDCHSIDFFPFFIMALFEEDWLFYFKAILVDFFLEGSYFFVVLFT